MCYLNQCLLTVGKWTVGWIVTSFVISPLTILRKTHDDTKGKNIGTILQDDLIPIQTVQFSSVTQLSLTLCDPMDCSMPGCPSPTPRVYSNSCPLSRCCYPTISSSVVRFSSRFQSCPASGSFQMNQFFASGGQVLEFQLQHQSFQWILKIDLL